LLMLRGTKRELMLLYDYVKSVIKIDDCTR
jgi:hypothetical protein